MVSKPEASEPVDADNVGFWDFVDIAVETISRKYPTVNAEAMAASMTLRRAYDIIYYDLHAELRRSDSALAYPGLRVLLVLTICENLELRQVARFSGLSRASASAIVENLVKEGLVVRVPSQTDRRSAMVSLTDAGRKKFEDTFMIFNDREAWWMEGVAKDDIEDLMRVLKRIVSKRLGSADLHMRD